MEFVANDALDNFVFPNNLHIVWSLMITIYPFITGLIAGAFIVSTLSHVMKIKEFEPLAKFALVAAFCFGLFAAVPLLVHLGQPQRAFEIYFTPHTTSAMSVFGYVYGGYMILLTIELWFVYREYFIKMFNESRGLARAIWYTLSIGIRSYHPDAHVVDRRSTYILSLIGIPWAFLLHGYVGFVFGSVKAIPWWATALQPIIFLSSAVVSGMAMLMLLYSFIKWRSREPVDYVMIKKFAAILWGIFIIDGGLELLELVHVWYRNDYDWTQIEPLITGPLFFSYVVLQLLILSLIPFIFLGIAVLGEVGNKATYYLSNIGAAVLVMQVLVMRWNVVVGGQLISKSGRGFVHFDWLIWGKEGILMSLLILSMPFVVYYIVSRFLPIFEKEETVTW